MEEKSAQTSTDRRMNMTDKTLDYYNKNAQSFVSGTVSVKFTQIQDKFLEKLKPHALILDFGCGSGYPIFLGHRISGRCHRRVSADVPDCQ